VKVHIFQHVPFEAPGSIETWARRANHEVGTTRFYAGDSIPTLDQVDLLVVMGGPMSVRDVDRSPWLTPEKGFVKAAVDGGKRVLGVCLGAQILAEVLGAEITRSPEKEIGWFPIWRVAEAGDSAVARALPHGEPVFHWHGETFGLPAGARRLARSEACENQAFLYGERVLGLQFHMEVAERGIRLMIEHSGDEIVPAPRVQTAGDMLGEVARTVEMNARMDQILDALAG
jgi:GMP synthase (glutamine-hydrolysing)